MGVVDWWRGLKRTLPLFSKEKARASEALVIAGVANPRNKVVRAVHKWAMYDYI